MFPHEGLGQSLTPCQGELGCQGLGHGKKVMLPSIHVPFEKTRPLCAQHGASSDKATGKPWSPDTLVGGRTMTCIVSYFQSGTSRGHPAGLGWGEVELCQGGGGNEAARWSLMTPGSPSPLCQPAFPPSHFWWAQRDL